jgi:preprotein translocase subunit SecD
MAVNPTRTSGLALSMLCALTMQSCTAKESETRGLPNPKSASNSELTSELTSDASGDATTATNASTSAESQQLCETTKNAWKVALGDEMHIGDLVPTTEPSTAHMNDFQEAVEKRIARATSSLDSGCKPSTSVNGRLVVAFIPSTVDAKKIFATTTAVQFRPVLAELPKEGVDEARRVIENDPAARSTQTILVSEDGRAYDVGPNEASGAPVTSASARVNENGVFVIDVQLSKQGATEFNAMAKKFAGRQIAVVVNGIVISAPTVNGPNFPDGRVQITGNFSETEAKALATAMTNEAFPYELVSLSPID